MNDSAAEDSLNLSSLSDTDNTLKGANGPVTRICEYCEVKLDNPQLDKYYELGKTWRNREDEIAEQKIEWYRDTIKELQTQISHERETLTIAELNHNTKKQ